MEPRASRPRGHSPRSAPETTKIQAKATWNQGVYSWAPGWPAAVLPGVSLTLRLLGIANKHSIQRLGVRLFEIAQAPPVCSRSNMSSVVVVRIKHSNAYNVRSMAFR